MLHTWHCHIRMQLDMRKHIHALAGNLHSCEVVLDPGGQQLRQKVVLKVHCNAHVQMASELESYLH